MKPKRHLDKADPTSADELRPEYKRSDFTEPFVRGKYAERAWESSNVVVLHSKVAKVFPNEDAVNDALMSLVKLAQRTTRTTD